MSVLFVPLLEYLFKGSSSNKKVIQDNDDSNSNKTSNGISSLIPAFLAILGVGFLELSGVEGYHYERNHFIVIFVKINVHIYGQVQHGKICFFSSLHYHLVCVSGVLNNLGKHIKENHPRL